MNGALSDGYRAVSARKEFLIPVPASLEVFIMREKSGLFRSRKADIWMLGDCVTKAGRAALGRSDHKEGWLDHASIVDSFRDGGIQTVKREEISLAESGRYERTDANSWPFFHRSKCSSA